MGQHKLSDDSLLAIEGNFMETRMSNWKEEKKIFSLRSPNNDVTCDDNETRNHKRSGQ